MLLIRFVNTRAGADNASQKNAAPGPILAITDIARLIQQMWVLGAGGRPGLSPVSRFWIRGTLPQTLYVMSAGLERGGIWWTRARVKKSIILTRAIQRGGRQAAASTCRSNRFSQFAPPKPDRGELRPHEAGRFYNLITWMRNIGTPSAGSIAASQLVESTQI